MTLRLDPLFVVAVYSENHDACTELYMLQAQNKEWVVARGSETEMDKDVESGGSLQIAMRALGAS